MTAPIPHRPPWEQQSYRRIERADYDEATGLATVRFVDGTTASFDPAPLLPPNLTEIDWWRLAANRIEILVPHSGGWFEIPWDVIRRHTDAAFAAHWLNSTVDKTR